MPDRQGSTPAELVRCANCGRMNRVPAAARGTPRCGNCHKPLPWVAAAGDDTFAEVAEAAAIPVVVDIWAPWCGPCRAIAPMVEDLARQYKGKVKVGKMNVDDQEKVPQTYQIMSIPTLLFFKDGKLAGQIIGTVPKAKIEGELKRHL